jgi:hypothetical protein
MALPRDPERSYTKSVVVIRRSLRAQQVRVRGSSFSSFDVVDEYKRAGWRVITLDDPTASSIARAVSESRAWVVHANVPVSDGARTGGLYLDVGRELEESVTKVRSSAAGRRTQGLPVADLVECLRGPSRGQSPVLVLDPPFVPTDTEAVRQLTLRNAFASDVFQLGVMPAIIGTGLLRGDKYRDVASALVAGFESGQPLSIVCTTMRRAGADPQEIVQFSVATALYTHYADYAPSGAAR